MSWLKWLLEFAMKFAGCLWAVILNWWRTWRCTTSRDGVIGAEGLSVAVSVGDTNPDQLPAATDVFDIVERANTDCDYPCGHRGAAWFVIDTYGMRTKKLGGEEWPCSECTLALFKKNIIRCALCALSITPGEGVALYSAHSPGVKRKIATLVGEDSVIGCMRWDCCPSGGFFAGNWSENGFIPRFKGHTAAGHVFATGETTYTEVDGE